MITLREQIAELECERCALNVRLHNNAERLRELRMQLAAEPEYDAENHPLRANHGSVTPVSDSAEPHGKLPP